MLKKKCRERFKKWNARGRENQTFVRKECRESLVE
jgi:hypothetical protein